MTHDALDPVHPVEIGALTPGHRTREVHIERPGTSAVVVACSSRRQFEDVLQRERPDLSPDDSASIHWADHPGEWPETA